MELEQDEIQPDNLTRSREKLFIKSLKPSENDYEDSLNLNLSSDENRKYRGSAQNALKQDLYKMYEEVNKANRAESQRKLKLI
jgi:hypothetical protein